jgi:hypothetical protein
VVYSLLVQIMDSHAWLKGDSYDRPHPSRMVHDVEISAGYMHSGYPVSGHPQRRLLCQGRTALLPARPMLPRSMCACHCWLSLPIVLCLLQFMTFLDVVDSTLVFPPTGPGHWGHVHELGHNEQVRVWQQ